MGNAVNFLKTVWGKPHGGSNPSSCANESTQSGAFFVGAGRGCKESPNYRGFVRRAKVENIRARHLCLFMLAFFVKACYTLRENNQKEIVCSTIMEFNQKLQELRKQKGLTQEELAEALCVSRAAVAKWESGRGYPNLESLKDIAKFFSLTIDELLSGGEVLKIAEKDGQRKTRKICDLLFGILDCSVLLLLFLPLFAQRIEGGVQEVSLLSLTQISVYLRIAYFIAVGITAAFGVVMLALQNCNHIFWLRSKNKISLILNVGGALLFIISLQAYAAAFSFLFLIIKAALLLKNK